MFLPRRTPVFEFSCFGGLRSGFFLFLPLVQPFFSSSATSLSRRSLLTAVSKLPDVGNPVGHPGVGDDSLVQAVEQGELAVFGKPKVVFFVFFPLR